MRILLLRHGDAGDKASWSGHDRHRPLTSRGHRDAAALVELAQLGPVSIVSSPYLRCMQTVAPLAAHLALDVIEAAQLEPSNIPEAIDFLRSCGGSGPLVACTHREIIGQVLDVLRGVDRLDVGAKPPHDKASTWILTRRGERFIEAQYRGAPTVPGAGRRRRLTGAGDLGREVHVSVSPPSGDG